MRHGLGDSVAMGESAEIATVMKDVVADIGDGIGGASGHRGGRRAEHFEVIMAIADGKNAGGWDVPLLGNAAEGAALLEIAIAEAQINRAALPSKSGVWRDSLDDFLENPIHFLLRARDEAGWFTGHLDPLRTGVFLDELSDLAEEWRAFEEKAGNFALTAAIPCLIGGPRSTIATEINFAFTGDDEIGIDGKTSFFHALQQMFERASGIDAPGCLKVASDAKQFGKKCA